MRQIKVRGACFRAAHVGARHRSFVRHMFAHGMFFARHTHSRVIARFPWRVVKAGQTCANFSVPVPRPPSSNTARHTIPQEALYCTLSARTTPHAPPVAYHRHNLERASQIGALNQLWDRM